VALSLCRTDEARQIVRAILLDVLYPMEPRYPNDIQAERHAIDAFHQVLEAALQACLVTAGGDRVWWMEIPTKEDSSCQSYCPRCDRQFVFMEGTCASCNGISLVRFD